MCDERLPPGWRGPAVGGREVGVGDTAEHAIFLPFSVVAMNFLPSNCDPFRTRTRQGERPIGAITPVESYQSAFTDELRAW